MTQHKLTPESLETAGYQLLETLPHEALLPFVQTYIKKRTVYAWFYKGINICLLVLLIVSISFWTNKGVMALDKALAQAGLGFAASFLLIPLHEYIHALAYRQQGATHTSFDAHWRKFYFMAVADRFVADKAAFRIVALAPFVVISAFFLLLLRGPSPEWVLAIVSGLLAHTSFCSGDFALLSYFEYHKDKVIVTYDDKAAKTSYFYYKNRE